MSEQCRKLIPIGASDHERAQLLEEFNELR
jgi:hypothetical protein